jgi:hypothetical protein
VENAGPAALPQRAAPARVRLRSLVGGVADNACMPTDAAPAACSWCGRTAADGPPPTWTAQLGPRGVEYLCEQCTREHVREIESSLSTDYW